MKKLRILLLAALCAALLAAAGTAAADGMTWAGLQQALNAGGTVSLTDDVTASASDGPLVVPAGVTVRLDLNGRTVSRGLSAAVENGSVIRVEGALTLEDSGTGGKVTGGFAANGGGIYNGGSLTVEGGSIEGNSASQDGGGIYNAGTLAMRAGSVSGNTAGRNGGGVYNAASLTMEGTPVVQDNTGSNVYLPEGKLIGITNSMRSGARIGITSPAFVATFTEHYGDFFHPAPSSFFFSDVEGHRISRNGYMENDPESYEGRWETILTYLSVDTYGRSVYTLDTNYTLLTSSSTDLTKTWYVAYGDVTVSDRLNVLDSSVNILLLDGAVLRASKGIYVGSGSMLTIYGQSGETGQLIATGASGGAGIGGRKESGYGTIYIRSGRIQAAGGEWAAGIGGGYDASNGDGLVAVYGGYVTAQGGAYGAGIGGGGDDTDDQKYGDPGRLLFYGGTVSATGGSSGAGIGSGNNAINRGSIEIHGGTISAYGSTAYGGTAGIGGGFSSDNDNMTVLITGGQVYAEGKGRAAGIGGGNGSGVDEGCGCKVTITGGTVTAVSSHHAIGKGEVGYSNHHGTLSLYDLAWVKAGASGDDAAPVASGSRVSACRDSQYVRIEPCAHANVAYTFGSFEHTGTCPNCLQGAITGPHQYADGVCGLCGYASTNWVIVFDTNGGTGTMPAVEVYRGHAVNLPDCTFRAPDGMAFAGWQIGDDDEVYPAGELITPGGHITAKATWTESTWSLLQEQINSTADSGTLLLTADLTASASDDGLRVPAGLRFTLDLNGHTLSGSDVLGTVLTVSGGAELTLTDSAGGGAITHGKWYGIYVQSNGSLTMDSVEIRSCGQGMQIYYNAAATMTGGAVRDCTNNGGVIVYGSFTMTDGSISNNASTAYSVAGGVTVSGTFRMTGGSISNNWGNSGGGVFVETAGGCFIMEGGSVTGNAAPHGGGVYVSNNNVGGGVTLSGSASITGNAGRNGAAANLVLSEDIYKRFTPVAMASPVSGRVGVTIEPYSENDTDLTPTFTTGLNGRSTGGFFSDNPAYSIGLDANGEACFVDPAVLAAPDFRLPLGTSEIQSEAFVGIRATVVYIPDGCAVIGAGAFRDCPNLRQILIPADCAVGKDAFAGDFGLMIFGYTGSSAEAYCSEHPYCVFVPLD